MPDNLRETIKEDIQEHGLWGFVRGSFVTGLLVAGPAVVTWWLLTSVVFWVDDVLKGVLPEVLHVEVANIPGLGLLGGAVLLVVVGALARNYFGKYLVEWMDRTMESIPLVRGIYGAAKQLVDVLGGRGEGARFGEVVLLEYPRKELWVVGFVAGPSPFSPTKKKKDNMLTVFVPSAPSPTNGFVILVDEKDVVYPGISVDDGWKMVMSGGIVVPKKKG